MLDFIINPSAGKKTNKIKKALPKIEKHLVERQIPYVIHMTKTPHHATELTQTLIKNGATDIIVVGGDGTLHEVINGFSNFDKVNMGIIPCGTGNDFASALKLPTDPVEALDIILDEQAKYTDFMQMPTVRGLNVIGMGLDVEVLKRYAKAKRKTKFAYTWCLIKTLFKFKCIDFDAQLNEQTAHHHSFLAAICNGHCFGGGIPVCPVADAGDKKIDFLAVREISKLGLIKAFIKLKKGKILEFKETTHTKTESVKITTADAHYTVNVDGELYDDIPFEIQIISDTLKVYRP